MSTDNEVGYKKPPITGRFPKGKSGNPKGRPKGPTGMKAAFEKALEQKMSIRQGDRQRWVTVQEAMFMSLIKDAIQGKTKAFELAFKMADKFGLVSPSSGTPQQDADNRFVWTEEDESLLPFIEHLLHGDEKPLAEADPKEADDSTQDQNQEKDEPKGA